ncbi:hypothetical protein LVJ78_00885 [Uruburuella suis]|uniref:Uncharacterized protein n=1 Tax=Uruburuella suis TaxID=252130 RepID=A0AAE9GV81_9NEIS|nr:hypothetical protein [Uruburuella suis]UOO79624.1 hypothetical protein LVJ78_00885 [Uruburuella suis]
MGAASVAADVVRIWPLFSILPAEVSTNWRSACKVPAFFTPKPFSLAIRVMLPAYMLPKAAVSMASAGLVPAALPLLISPLA